jgi:hypothetical protein
LDAVEEYWTLEPEVTKTYYLLNFIMNLKEKKIDVKNDLKLRASAF